MILVDAAGVVDCQHGGPTGPRGSEDVMKTIVVGYDETEMAQRALARAADLAAAFGSKVIVTSIAPLPDNSHEPGPLDPADLPAQDRAELDHTHRELDHAKTFLRRHGIEGQFEITLGDPATAIVELADKYQADMIIIGTQRPSLAEVVGRIWTPEHNTHCDLLTV